MQAVCIPFVGVIGNLCNRLILIAVGTMIWGAMSVGMGFAANFQEVSPVFFRATSSLLAWLSWC